MIPVKRLNICRLFCVVIVGATLSVTAQSEEKVEPVFQHEIPNVDHRSVVAVVVTYPPGAKSKPHHHAASAFIYAYVLSGQIRSQVDGQPAKVYRAGESFSESPGSHHVISENASQTKSARLLAVFVVDPKEHDTLTIADEK